MKRIARFALPVMATLALAALTGCGQRELIDSAPAHSELAEAPSTTPTPYPTETPLLGAPAPAPEPEPTGAWTMAPIPNPAEPRARPRSASSTTTPRGPTSKPASTPVAASPAAKLPPAPPAAKQPAEKTPPAIKPAPNAAPGSPAAKLGLALAADVSAGARLAIPDGLPNGYQGIVVLTLPDNFAARLKDEARRLGLGDAAKVTDLRAALTGDGYEIKPTTSQVVRLGEEPVKIAWLVAESSDRATKRTPLRAEIVGELRGGRVATSFPLASIGAVPSSLPQTPAKAPASQISAKGLTLAVPLLLILVALFILGRWAKARRDEKARRRAALEQFHT